MGSRFEQRRPARLDGGRWPVIEMRLTGGIGSREFRRVKSTAGRVALAGTCLLVQKCLKFGSVFGGEAHEKEAHSQPFVGVLDAGLYLNRAPIRIAQLEPELQGRPDGKGRDVFQVNPPHADVRAAPHSDAHDLNLFDKVNAREGSPLFHQRNPPGCVGRKSPDLSLVIQVILNIPGGRKCVKK